MLVRELLLFLQGTGLFGLRSAYSRAASCPMRTECLLSVRCSAPCIQPIVSLLFSLHGGSGLHRDPRLSGTMVGYVTSLSGIVFCDIPGDWSEEESRQVGSPEE